jgi:hypothetical protein
MGVFMPLVDDQIPSAANPREGLGKDEHRVALVQGTRQQRDRTRDRLNHQNATGTTNCFFFLVACHCATKRGKKIALPSHPHHLPDAPVHTKKLSVIPRQVRQLILAPD